VLVVGASNSGAEIALDIARAGDGRDVWLSGRHPGHLPYNIDGLLRSFLSPLLFRVVFHRLFTIDTPVGRQSAPEVPQQGQPAHPFATRVIWMPRAFSVFRGWSVVGRRASNARGSGRCSM
jgi:cation diffusion facilitator CzcD-associated flavoprotein CzcO